MKLKTKKTKKRDVEVDAMITILNLWRDGNDSGELKIDAFYLLSKWAGPEMCRKVTNQINSLGKACRDKDLATDYIELVISKVYGMFEYLRYCKDPELEYAGRYARKRWFMSLGIWLDD